MCLTRGLIQMAQKSKRQRDYIQSCKFWSRYFILTSACTEWYKGKDVKFVAMAGSEEELVKVVTSRVKQLAHLTQNERIVIRFNVTPRSLLIKGVDAKFYPLDVENLKAGRLPGEKILFSLCILSRSP